MEGLIALKDGGLVLVAVVTLLGAAERSGGVRGVRAGVSEWPPWAVAVARCRGWVGRTPSGGGRDATTGVLLRLLPRPGDDTPPACRPRSWLRLSGSTTTTVAAPRGGAGRVSAPPGPQVSEGRPSAASCSFASARAGRGLPWWVCGGRVARQQRDLRRPGTVWAYRGPRAAARGP